MNKDHQKSKYSNLRLKSTRSLRRCSSDGVLSKYLTTPTLVSITLPNSQDAQQSDDLESPYLRNLTKIGAVNVDTSTEESDFKTPKPVKIQKYVKQPSNATNRLKPTKATRKKTRQTVFTKINSKYTLDVDPEQLQVALALSLSEYDNTIDHRATIAQTLEQFGFTSKRPTLEVGEHRVPIVKRKKTSKFRYVTPVLLTRTEVDRQRLISDKTSNIVNENLNIHLTSESTSRHSLNLRSTTLQRCWNRNADIFNVSGKDYTDVPIELFYLKTLSNIAPSNSKTGCLLRDWSSIPGRPLSPNPRNNTVDILEIPKTSYRSISPDLFESDEETLDRNEDLKITERIFSPKKSENNSLNTERECNSEAMASMISCLDNNADEDVMDLTQSSDEDVFSQESNKNNFVGNVLPVFNYATSFCAREVNFAESMTPVVKNARYTDSDDLNDDGCAEGHFVKAVSPALNASSYYSNEQYSSPKHNEDNFETDLPPNCAPILSTPTHSDDNADVMDLTQSSDDDCSSKSNKNNFVGNISPVPNNCRSLFARDFNEDISSLKDNKVNFVENVLPAYTDARSPYFCDVNVDSSSPKHNKDDFVEAVSPVLNSYYSNEGYLSPKRNQDNFESVVSPILNTTNCRRSSILNVTDYVHNVLNHNQDQEFYDLTVMPSSPESPAEKTSEGHSNTFGNKIQHSQEGTDILPEFDQEPNFLSSNNEIKIHDDVGRSSCSTWPDDAATPKSKMIIKTTNITPMANYDGMPTPDIQSELTKFGLKTFKRNKGVKILKHIYEMTHPVGTQMEMVSDDEDERLLKKRKTEFTSKSKRSIKKYNSEPCIKPSHLLSRMLDNDMVTLPKQTGLFNLTRDESIEILNHNNLETETDDMIFETKQSKRVATCKVPFHIVFHNLVSANPILQEKILLYEPLKLADLYKTIQDLGYRFAIKDIESFLQKKCITIRTQQNHTVTKSKKKKLSNSQH